MNYDLQYSTKMQREDLFVRNVSAKLRAIGEGVALDHVLVDRKDFGLEFSYDGYTAELHLEETEYTVRCYSETTVGSIRFPMVYDHEDNSDAVAIIVNWLISNKASVTPEAAPAN